MGSRCRKIRESFHWRPNVVKRLYIPEELFVSPLSVAVMPTWPYIVSQGPPTSSPKPFTTSPGHASPHPTSLHLILAYLTSLQIALLISLYRTLHHLTLLHLTLV
ncbi:hypothetical protein Pmani_011484 [Petrolisthes manimaculis]|uniref:Uncharacterized protein n=1 Tax=Petrolisthes manimaculis TaxID=1843537 RepID=A0AAE1Q2C1_9EUCA|nr:hypothetical protein Pmani_011484 [Petrolisthes manimaculis]